MKKEECKNGVRIFEWLALASLLPLILAPSAFAARVIGFSQMQLKVVFVFSVLSAIIFTLKSTRKKEKNGFHSLANAPRQDLMPPQTKSIKQNLYKYPSDGHIFSVVERARSLRDKALLWLRRGCEFENDSEISPRSHWYNKKEENQAHSLNKAPVWLRRVSHEFFLDSEKHRNSHTVEAIKYYRYLNFSVFAVLIAALLLAPSAYAARVIGFSQMQSGEGLSLSSSTLNFFAAYNKVMIL